MKKNYSVDLRIKAIYLCIVILLLGVIFIMNYGFKHSRNLLIEQEAGIISQYMNRNELALVDVTDSIRKLSAASSSNKQVATYLNQSSNGNIYSSENLNRIHSVEETLTFYRNIFFDYRLHYIILGVDGTVYSVADGIDNNTYFGKQFSSSIKNQDWYQKSLSSKEVSQWVAPCVYDNKGEFKNNENGGETFIVFMRKINDYISQKFLGVSFVSFPAKNLSQVLVPYDGASLALFNENSQLIYTGEDNNIFLNLDIKNMYEKTESGEGYFHYTKDGVEYLVNYVTMASTGWQLINLVPLAEITEAVDKLYNLVSSLTLLLVFGAGAICLIMYIYVNAPLNRLVYKVSKVNIGGTKISDVEKIGWKGFGVVEAEREISRMVDYIEALSEQTIKQKEIEQNLRYEMLRAKLNPHFLFNTLNAIKWSAMMSGASNIADMITSLGILLENSMSRKEEEVSLAEEIKVVKAWVEIKNWALKNRIRLSVEIPKELEEFKVIKFCLQPLVENAVLHGMENVENGEIIICASRCEEKVCIRIQDNGVGMNRDKLGQIIREIDENSKQRHVTGIGLTSIHELMKIKYGSSYGLHIESELGNGTTVFVVFPYMEVKEDAESSNC